MVSLTTDLPGKGGACYQMLTRYSAGLRDALQAYVMRCCTLAFLMGCVTQCSRDLSCPYRLLPGRAAGKAAVSDAASAAGKAKKGLAGMPSKSASGKAVSFTRITAS